MFSQDDIITGEKFEDLAHVSISKAEHRDFESKNSSWIDVDSFDFNNFNNPDLIYVNSSLFNKHKPKLVASDIISKLYLFKNKFSLILHNSDQDFESRNLDILDIPNLDKIYTQNIAIHHPRVIPLPIGLANSRWTHGNLSVFCDQVNSKHIKSNLIYNNFTIEGGMRPEYRRSCAEAATSLELPQQSSKPYREFLKELSSYRFCLCPSGNGLDTHRFWECLYLKTIPIVKRKPLYEYFSTLFPCLIVDDWNDIDINSLVRAYETADWSNYSLLKFNNFINYINLS